MPTLTFYPLGNADCCRIDLSDGQMLLIDFAAMRDEDDQNDRRIDLPEELEKDLKDSERDGYEVVAFTHLDRDHTQGAGDFFWLDHAERYQGGGRKKIRTLWVPAAVITESRSELERDARIIQAEARHRLKQGYGNAFSLAQNGLRTGSRRMA